MVQILERVQAHYEAREIPFGTTYEWHPSYVALECTCGEKVTLKSSTTMTTCRSCRADLGTFVRDIREHEGRLRYELIHPWFYDAKESEEHQH